MRATRTNETALIVAAQAGDRRALDELVLTHLPLVYTIVNRALDGRADVDDVVQEVMLRAVQQLRMLREPDSFRAWLAAIAVRRVSTHLHRVRQVTERLTALDDVTELPDVEADVEGLTLLRLELSAQRRQAVRAGRWLDPGDRALLSLWWLEIAGQLNRTELAAALGVSVAHAGVRVQRLRVQLDLSRSIVASLEANPGCAQLRGVTAEWDGRPGPLWRKRIARHTRSCPVCVHAADEMVPAERLLVGVALLPVPLAVTAALLAKTTSTAAAAVATSTVTLSGGAGAGVKAGLLGQLIQLVGAHPVAASVAAGALVVGATVTTTTWPAPAPPAPAVIVAPTSAPAVARTTPGGPRPSAAAPPVPPPTAAADPPVSPGPAVVGPVSFESLNMPGRFVVIEGGLGFLKAVAPAGGGPTGQLVNLEAVPGLTDPTCFSFRSPDGRYLRHASWRVQLGQDEGTELFRGDATFCVRDGYLPGSVSFEASNYPGWFLRHRNFELWVDHSDGSPLFRTDSSFLVRPPQAG